MQISATMRRHPRRTAIVGVVLVALVALGLWWFAPWNLVVDRTVDEALPGASEPGAGSQGPADEAGAGGGAGNARAGRLQQPRTRDLRGRVGGQAGGRYLLPAPRGSRDLERARP